MCGVLGFWATRDERLDPLAELSRMGAPLAHRGPDDSGSWWDPTARVGLAHRRLSIVDLSVEGHQPMVSSSGRYVISFNGEVYNFEAIRSELRSSGRLGGSFRGHSDTEVMLAAVEAWGLTEAVARFVGMFAFALWDRQDRRLHLVRDRLGVKPLYYGLAGTTLVFGSELKALTAASGFPMSIDRAALAAFLRYGYVPGPVSIYEAAKKVRPGAALTFDAPTAEPREYTYWSAADAARRGMTAPFDGDDDDARNEVERVLRDAVSLRMVADVPLGAFLSGGVDSSTVVACMQALSAQPVRTFSIGLADARYDESVAAEAVARHLGTAHTSLVVSAGDVLPLVPELSRSYDEPFADSSQIPTYVVSRLARRDVTVALSGDGGDELFGGYNRHIWGPRVWSAVGAAPRPFRRAVSRGLSSVSPERWERLHATLGPFAPAMRLAGDKAHKLSRVLRANSPSDVYRALVSRWEDPASLLAQAAAEAPVPRPEGATRSLAEDMMLWDALSYLPDDIMTKVDRASMAVSLEAREPLLDHRLVELAFRLPLRMKIRNGTSKWILREVLHRYVPRKLVDRPKMGFSIPIGDWLRGPLRPWAEDLLDPRRMSEDGLLNPAAIVSAWHDHTSGRKNLGEQLWTIVALLAWLRR